MQGLHLAMVWYYRGDLQLVLRKTNTIGDTTKYNVLPPFQNNSYVWT